MARELNTLADGPNYWTAWAPSQHRCSPQRGKVKAGVFFMVAPPKSHTIISRISCWFQRSTLFNLGRNHTRALIAVGRNHWEPTWKLATRIYNGISLVSLTFRSKSDRYFKLQQLLPWSLTKIPTPKSLLSSPAFLRVSREAIILPHSTFICQELWLHCSTGNCHWGNGALGAKSGSICFKVKESPLYSESPSPLVTRCFCWAWYYYL